MTKMMAGRRRGLVQFSQRLVWPLAALTLVLVLLHLSPLPLKHVFTVLFTSILLAAAISPAARYLSRYRVPRGVTILLAYLLALLILGGVVALVIPLVVSEVISLQGSLPLYARELQFQIQRFAPDQAAQFSADAVASQLSGRLSALAEGLTGVVLSLFTTSITVILILVMAYFMASEENFARLVVLRLVPPDQRDRVSRLMGRTGTRLGEWARAQLLLALFFGVAFGVGLRVTGVHYAVTLAMVGAVLEIIPYVGGFITVALAVLVALTQKPILVVWVLAWYAIVVELEGHVIAPKLMDRVLGIHPLVIVVALFLGGESLGIFGALLAVPIAIVFQVLLDEFYKFSPAVASANGAIGALDSVVESAPENSAAAELEKPAPVP